MGLDMSIYRISSPDVIADRIYKSGELHGILLDKSDREDPMYRDILPYCREVKVLNSYYDIEKIRKDYDLSEEDHIWMYCNKGISISDKKRGKNVAISSVDVDEKYLISKIETMWFAKPEEVRYWRNQDSIRDWFYSKIGDVENCGYYLLPGYMLKKFNETFPDDFVEPEDPTGTSALFYHEWY